MTQGALIIDVLTIFPEMFRGVIDESIIGRARNADLVRIHLTNIRDFTQDKHRSVDDRPFGGGPGMVMKPEPVFDAVEHVMGEHGRGHLVLLRQLGKSFALSEYHRRGQNDDGLGLSAQRGEGSGEVFGFIHLKNLEFNVQRSCDIAHGLQVRVAWSGIPQHGNA